MPPRLVPVAVVSFHGLESPDGSEISPSRKRPKR
jgi:hypothetical protein